MVRLFNLLFSKEVRPIIETIKKIIKNKKKDSPIKLLALKLLNDCLTQAVNEDFLSYTDQKIMSRLGKMARFKKVSLILKLKQEYTILSKSFSNLIKTY